MSPLSLSLPPSKILSLFSVFMDASSSLNSIKAPAVAFVHTGHQFQILLGPAAAFGRIQLTGPRRTCSMVSYTMSVTLSVTMVGALVTFLSMIVPFRLYEAQFFNE